MKDLTTLEKCGMLSKQECNLLEFLRGIKYGRVTVFIKDGKPVRGEEPLKTIQF